MLCYLTAPVVNADEALPTPTTNLQGVPLWTGAPSRDDLAQMAPEAKAKTSWIEFPAVAAALQDINHEQVICTTRQYPC